jgi:quinol monooxygenase YgiN
LAALEHHRSTEYYAKAQKKGAEDKLLAAAPDIKVITPVGGFGLRG